MIMATDDEIRRAAGRAAAAALQERLRLTPEQRLRRMALFVEGLRRLRSAAARSRRGA